MPRKAKTLSGKPAQSPQDIPGQQYGAVVAGHRLQESMPTPQVGPGSASPAAGQASPVVPQGQPAPSLPPADPFAAAQAMNPGGALLAQTGRPDEPITAGLTRGPGPGPEVLGVQGRTPLGDMLRLMSDVTRDPRFAEMATRSRL